MPSNAIECHRMPSNAQRLNWPQKLQNLRCNADWSLKFKLRGQWLWWHSLQSVWLRPKQGDSGLNPASTNKFIASVYFVTAEKKKIKEKRPPLKWIQLIYKCHCLLIHENNCIKYLNLGSLFMLHSKLNLEHPRPSYACYVTKTIAQV